MATYKYKSNDTWTRGRMGSMGKRRKPDSIFDWSVGWEDVVQRKRKTGKAMGSGGA